MNDPMRELLTMVSLNPYNVRPNRDRNAPDEESWKAGVQDAADWLLEQYDLRDDLADHTEQGGDGE